MARVVTALGAGPRARTGTWYFEIRAEQKSCHSAIPPPTSEHVDFIVVEAGVSMEGWQAGLTRVNNADWHRISFLQETAAGVQPVVVSQVQTYDNRTKFVSTRHYFPPGLEAESNFVGVDLEMEWPDAREYCRAHFHDLASVHNADENTAVAKVCERNRNQVNEANEATISSTSTSHVCYFGINDVESEGSFRWSDGSTVNYEVWADGEPNDWYAEDGGEDWGGISSRAGVQSAGNLHEVGHWNDNGNIEGTGGAVMLQATFVCERHKSY